MRTMNHSTTKNACARALIAALALFALFLLGARARAESDGMLRILLTRLGAPDEIEMLADCDYTLASDPSVRVPAGATMRVRAADGALTLHVGDASMPLGATAKLLRAAGDGHGIAFRSPALSNRFCGDLTLAASGDVIAAVLDIYIEDYLRGVVGCEMAPSSGIEALKAQAVAARTYALWRKAARGGAAYDLSDAGDGLSYRGLNDSREYADALRAVKDTRGLVLTYGGELAAVGFCDSNGGQIESSQNALGTALPYSQVRDDPYDYEGTGVRKTATLRRDAEELKPELYEALVRGVVDALKGSTVSADPEDIAITAIEDTALESPRFDAPSRLYTVLALRLAVAGQSVLGDAQTFEVTVRVPTYGGLEQWYGLSINDQDNETVWLTDDERAFEITFRRSGSGLGMSQRGAQVMARKGLSCEDILDYYYPGVELTRYELSDAARADADSAGRQAAPEPIATARLSQKSRLYTKPDATQSALTTLPAGATVEVYAVQGEWAAVGSGALRGFTHAEALTSFQLNGVTVAQVKNETLARVNAGPVDVLQLPVATAAVLERLQEGSLVLLDAYTDAWALITTEAGVEGFITRDALTLQSTKRAEGGETVAAPEDLSGLVTEDTGLYVNADDSIEPRQQLSAGDYVRITAYNNAWAHVVTEDGQPGYVKLGALSAVQRVEPEQTAAPGIEGGEITWVEGEEYRTVTVEALSLFERYATDSKVLATLRRGEKVQVGAYNEIWAGVRVDGITGFVLVSGLSAPVADDGRDDGDAPEGGEFVRVKGALYAYAAADGTPIYPSWDAASQPLVLLGKGDRVQVGAYNRAWACVRIDGVTGFMRREALTKDPE